MQEPKGIHQFGEYSMDQLYFGHVLHFRSGHLHWKIHQMFNEQLRQARVEDWEIRYGNKFLIQGPFRFYDYLVLCAYVDEGVPQRVAHSVVQIHSVIVKHNSY